MATPIWLTIFVFGLHFVASSLDSIAVAQNQSFIFTAGGDHGAPNEADTRSSLQAIANSGAVFHLALGDLSYSDSGPEPTDGVTPSPWCSGTDPNRNIRLTIGETFPFQLIVGNHEDDDFVDGFINNFAVCLPDRMNSTGVYAAEYYSDYPQPNPYARFIMIGAGNDVNGVKYDYEPGNAHYAWLEATIDAARGSNIPWVIVGMHKNCLTIGNKSCEIGEALMDLLIAKRVDLVLQGHDHDYQRSKQLICANAGVFDASCVADDGADNVYSRGAGTLFLINGAFGGSGFTSIDCNDSERNYFASAMGGNGSVWRDGSCSTRRVGRGITVYTVSPDRIDAQFLMTYEVTGSGEPFYDSFSIINGNAPTPVVTPTVAPTNPPGGEVVTLNPVADAYVHEATPGENFGSSDALRTDASPVIRSYLRFQVPALSGNIARATLRVFAETSSGGGYQVYVTGGGWDESTINFTNAPALGSSFGSSAAFAANTWTTVDVTGLVTAAGQYDLALASADTTQVRFSSREGANPPQLIIDAVPTVPPTPSPIAGSMRDGIGIYARATGAWYLRNSASPGAPDYEANYGGGWAAPVAGDWNGDGADSLGVYDSANGNWYLRNSSNGGAPDITVSSYGGWWGLPISGDWDGNGSDNIGLFVPSTGEWLLRNSNSYGAPDVSFIYGGGWGYPVVGDWNGDGRDTIGIYNPTNGDWYLRNSNSGGGADAVVGGYGGWWGFPIAGDWDGDGRDTIGLFAYQTGLWLLRNSNSYGSPDISFSYGGSWGIPVSGDWNGSGSFPAGLMTFSDDWDRVNQTLNSLGAAYSLEDLLKFALDPSSPVGATATIRPTDAIEPTATEAAGRKPSPPPLMVTETESATVVPPTETLSPPSTMIPPEEATPDMAIPMSTTTLEQPTIGPNYPTNTPALEPPEASPIPAATFMPST
ncbi:MAG: DNRLRE domain-containing protein [Anaerolineae bacterium]|nr:DNRLRE domain-containing protein [Anaerolineae bacterium]